MAKKLVSAGFNVICEKPITVTADEARTLKRLVEEKGVIFGLSHTYTGYPMVRQMKSMIAQGKIGRVQKYMQNIIKVGLTLLYIRKRKEKSMEIKSKNVGFELLYGRYRCSCF